MANNTYVALATQTLASPAASVTFSSIPSGYTDLILIINGSTSVNEYVYFQVGNTTIDTGTNYSTTWLDSRVATARASNATAAFIGPATIANEKFNTIIHLQNYSNTSTNKTFLSRGNGVSTGAWVTANVNLWRSTSAINTVKFILGGSGNYNAGSTFTLYGIASANAGVAKATGGVISQDDVYFYHTFNSTGTFTPNQSITCDYLVVGGGGGGGNGNPQATGGGGGYVGYASASLTSGVSYTATIGAGGSSATAGASSSFNSLTMSGGGGGASAYYPNRGGSSGNNINGVVTNYLGGYTTSGVSNNQLAGGGGAGAGANGLDSSPFNATTVGSIGGNGYASNINGSIAYYGGGGNGGNEGTGSNGGWGTYVGYIPNYTSLGGGGWGGGQLASNPAAKPTSGQINTGGGGGGGTWDGSNPKVTGADFGASGGSGVVIVRYAK